MADPVEGHHYFAEFERLDDVADLDRAHALIRCPASGDGEWETYLRDGAWVLGKEPRHRVVLPVGRDDLERVIRGRETAEVRYFDVWHGFAAEDGRYRHDLVRRTGSTEETPDDLGWQHTDVLGRLEPGWWVLELGGRWPAGRSRGFLDQTHNYEAAFRDEDDAYDLSNALFLLKRQRNPYQLEYELWTPDGWQPTADMFLGHTTLPISEEEFQWLAAPRPGEPGAGNLER